MSAPKLPPRLYQRLHPVIKAIPQQRQTQDVLDEQLFALKIIANKCGLYDAADFLNKFIVPPDKNKL